MRACAGPYEMFECKVPDPVMSPNGMEINGSVEYVMTADERGAFDLKPCYDMCNSETKCGGFVRERVLLDTGVGLSGQVKCIWFPILKSLTNTTNVKEHANSYKVLQNIYGDEQTDTPNEICKKTFYQKRPGE